MGGLNRPSQGRGWNQEGFQVRSSAPPADLGRPAEVGGEYARSGEGGLSQVVDGREGLSDGGAGSSPCRGIAAEKMGMSIEQLMIS